MQLLRLIVLVSCFGSSQQSICQTNIELSCKDRIIANSKSISFPKYCDRIKLNGDTILFNYNSIHLLDTTEDAHAIVSSGLLYPMLILGVGSSPNAAFKMPAVMFIGTLKLSDFERLPDLESSATTRVYSFLRWQQGLANPSLYLIQFSNPQANAETNISRFLEKATLTAIGFCSILM